MIRLMSVKIWSSPSGLGTCLPSAEVATIIEEVVSMVNRFLLFLFITIPMPWSAATAATNESRCVILLLGDSLSAAYGMSTDEGWVALMNNQLKQRGYACHVVNASISGDTTQGGRARLPALLKQHKPTHLILELGANNGLRALPTEIMKQDLRWMIQQAKASSIKVLLVGMRMPPNYGPVYTKQFAKAYESLVKDEGVCFVPFFLEGVISQSEWMQTDTLHPNAQGQPRLLNNIWPELQLILPKKH